MLFITHDLSVLVEVCDRLAIMYAGKIVEEGLSAPVFAKPAHPYTEALAAAFPAIGDHAVPEGAVGTRRRSARNRTRCRRVARSTRGARYAFDECPTVVPDLYDAGEQRSAACLLVPKGALIVVVDPPRRRRRRSWRSAASTCRSRAGSVSGRVSSARRPPRRARSTVWT